MFGLATSAPATAAIPAASLLAGTSYLGSQAIFYGSLAARQAASMNAFTSSSELNPHNLCCAVQYIV